ncbi:hypothetical protein A2U01_0085085, partial [Trifolium medium]|nr:hypothetical protein [Trifolium medium]
MRRKPMLLEAVINNVICHTTVSAELIPLAFTSAIC